MRRELENRMAEIEYEYAYEMDSFDEYLANCASWAIEYDRLCKIYARYYEN